jgi:hypothetical protein
VGRLLIGLLRRFNLIGIQTMTNSLKTLENSLYWQKVVFKQSRDQKQKERVKARIDKLEAEIAKLLTA